MRLFSSSLLPSPSLLFVASLITTWTPLRVAAQGSLQRNVGHRRSLSSDNIKPASTPADGAVSGSALGFYETRPDYYRKCPSPHCGGAFVRPIDGSLVTCPGATEPSVECYVGGLRYSSINDEGPSWSGGVWIVYGSIVPGNHDGAPDVYNFDVQDGTTVAASLQMTLEYFVQHDDGGYWLSSVATNRTLCSDGSVDTSCYVASLNFSKLGLTAAEEQVVWDQLRDFGPDRGTVKGYYIDNPDYDGLTRWPGKGMLNGVELKDLFVVETSGSTQ
jgi:hypothetical protein